MFSDCEIQIVASKADEKGDVFNHGGRSFFYQSLSDRFKLCYTTVNLIIYRFLASSSK